MCRTGRGAVDGIEAGEGVGFGRMTHAEVAEILGSSVGTVKANLFHALANLRRLVRAGEERT